MHAHLPLDTQLLVATFTLQLRFTLEGVGQDLPATSTPTIELPLRTLLQPTTTSDDNGGAGCLDQHDSHAVDREMVQKAAWGLLQEAHEDDKLLTNDEMEALRAKEADGESQVFALRLPVSTGNENQWSDVMDAVDMMDNPNDFARWLRHQVMNAFMKASETDTRLPATTTFFLNLETLQATEDRPFHLALYLESTAHETFDSAAWKCYVHLLQVRARRQKAEGAFYGSLRALQDEPVVNTPAPPVWRRRQRKEAIQQLADWAGEYTIEATTESTGHGHVPKDHSNWPASTEYRSDSGSSCKRGGSSCKGAGSSCWRAATTSSV